MNVALIRPSYYRGLFLEFTGYLRNPHTTPSQKTTKAKITDLAGLFILKIVFMIGLGLFFALLSPFYDPENLTKSTMAERFSLPMLLLVGGLILPLLEEILFRLSLRFKPGHLALTLAVLTYYVATKAVYGVSLSLVDESLPTRVGSAVAVGVLAYPLLRAAPVRAVLGKLWTQHFRLIFYVTCVVFAWIHIMNYERTLINLLMMPIITLPQLASAFIYSYTRVSFGFPYPLGLHCCNNLIALILTQL
ncbi:hypothetical protein [Acanthopleuribacter pedis]|uniref:CPBP family intramembrane metalloprotease n=1 Tax=Acanthopleuribacter pedis TaxID=442870 RepID=A0A8J7Q5G9_9BACT|nr:hypothetical protein [Acanthopleuribacter pedis]MBO1319455.1 hypothetical protein [Acanthopleuribacter pedis]